VLREAVNEYLVPHGHEHSEDLIKDADTVKWIDRYAERYKQLVDPIWEQIINDPNSRWYRHGYRYKRLFRFQQQKQASAAAEGSSDGNGHKKSARARKEQKAGAATPAR
jgi:hypothetical protein